MSMGANGDIKSEADAHVILYTSDQHFFKWQLG